MRIDKTIVIDVSQKYLLSPIFAKQVDDGTRFVTIKLMNNSSQIVPESGSTARFRGVKQDQHSFDNIATINNDGTITVELTEQVLACAGYTYCDVAIIKNSTTLASANFVLDVQEIPMNGNTVVSSNEFTYLVRVTRESEGWAHGRSDLPDTINDNAKYYRELAEAYAHGKSGYPAMDHDNAKYWNQQTEALALDLSIVNGMLNISFEE